MKIIAHFLFQIIFAASLFSTENSLIYPHHIQADLQNEEHSTLAVSLEKFLEKGGTIIRLEDYDEPFQLQPGDTVFPACTAGHNRSQIVWKLLQPYADKIILNKPHATQYGLDPFNGKANWNRPKKPLVVDEFQLWAGSARQQKFGWDVFGEWTDKKEVSSEELHTLLDYYNREYYSLNTPAEARKVYIVFAKNVHVHLHRLSQSNGTLENVVILYMPLEDFIHTPLPEWNTFPGSLKSYEEFAKIIGARLDVSKLR
jgi:hypothetical protein